MARARRTELQHARGALRLHAVSRAARSGPLLTRLGFRVLGRRQQLDFYRQACRRMRRVAEAEMELREHQRLEKGLSSGG